VNTRGNENADHIRADHDDVVCEEVQVYVSIYFSWRINEYLLSSLRNILGKRLYWLFLFSTSKSIGCFEEASNMSQAEA